MRILLLVASAFVLASCYLTPKLHAQTQVVNTPRVSPKASIAQTIGITDVVISYSRPAVRGRELWGGVVPFGMTNPGWGTATSAPWRAGADENTIIYFSTAVSLNDVAVPAGTYGLFMSVEANGDVEIILSENTSSWGNYFFDEKEVVARAKTTWEEHGFTEYLEFSFDAFTPNSAYCALNWGNKSIPFEIAVDLNATVVEQLREDLRGTARFSYIGPMEAANWCVQHNTNLEEALEWATLAADMNPLFNTLLVKSEVHAALDQKSEAIKVMNQALPLATVYELHAYGRSLISDGKVDEALSVFESNAKLHKNTWPVNYGLARGYSAKGDYEKAISYLEKAQKNCPDEVNKRMIETNLKRLERKEDIN